MEQGEKMTEEKKICEYLEVLSSKAPVPGGGGASALAGALGNALGQMVVNLTVRKKKYAEVEEEMQEYLITAKVLGTGLSVILLLVGVMNFVNTMVVNVNTRRYELAILESIGMTKRQIKRMLFMEGFYYWGVSLSLAVTIGTAIFILLYMIFSKVAYYAVFSYPFIPLVLVSGLVLLICLIVPIWVYKTDVNLPVVERLRLTE